MATATKDKSPAKKNYKKPKAAPKKPKSFTPLKKAEVFDRTLELVEEIQALNIPASSYSQGPEGNEIFVVSKGNGIPGSLLFWTGGSHVDVKVYGDKSQRQAVLVINEQARTITRNVNFNRYNFSGSAVAAWANSYTESSVRMPSDADLKRSLSQLSMRNNFGLSLPDTAKFKALSFEEHNTGYNRQVKVQVEASVLQSELCFLVGVDESSVFVALLNETVRSVKAAHDSLRPKGVPAGSPRHGEWFFVPANKSELAAIKGRSIHKNNPLERVQYIDSTHKAAEFVQVDTYNPPRTFAQGRIYDTRAGHHSDLELENWHRVWRNNEKVMPAKVRRWD